MEKFTSKIIASSPSTSGFQTGAITLQDIDGQVANRYTAKLVQEGEKTYIQLTPTGVVTPPTPSTPSTPPTQNPTSSQENYISNTHSIASELEIEYPKVAPR